MTLRQPRRQRGFFLGTSFLGMRMEAARKPDDPRLAELVGDLRFS